MAFMLIKVRVTPNAKKTEIIKEGEILKVRLKASAVDGKANSALIEILAGYFRVRKSGVRIVKGQKSRQKVVEVG